MRAQHLTSRTERHERFKKVCVTLAQTMYRYEVRLRTYISFHKTSSLSHDVGISERHLSLARYVTEGAGFTIFCPFGANRFLFISVCKGSSCTINSHFECWVALTRPPISWSELHGKKYFTGASPQHLLHLLIFRTFSAHTTEAQQA